VAAAADWLALAAVLEPDSPVCGTVFVFEAAAGWLAFPAGLGLGRPPGVPLLVPEAGATWAAGAVAPPEFPWGLCRP